VQKSTGGSLQKRKRKDKECETAAKGLIKKKDKKMTAYFGQS
jgi:hypothetical protein